MIRHVEMCLRIGIEKVGWALWCTWERAIGGIKGSLPHLSELVENPWIGGLVCFVVHEEHDSLSAENHAGEGRPIVQRHGDLGWYVCVILKTRFFDEGNVFVDFGIISIAEQNGNDVKGMCLHPIVDFAKIRCNRTGVQYVTGSMAEMWNASIPLNLSL